MSRLLRVLVMLADSPDGVPVDRLVDVADFATADPAVARIQLERELRHLRGLGYDVANTAVAGGEARYVLRRRDNRLIVALSPTERRELARAAAAAGRGDLVARVAEEPPTPSAPHGLVIDLPRPPPHLGDVVRAVGSRCLVRFAYSGRPRVAHPAAVISGPSGWYLRAREDGDDTVKTYLVRRMGDVDIDEPGTAETVVEIAREGSDPLDWRSDPPIDVVVETSPDHLEEVQRQLRDTVVVHRDADTVVLAVRVTNRERFRALLYELGLRCRVTGPPAALAAIVAELRSATRGA